MSLRSKQREEHHASMSDIHPHRKGTSVALFKRSGCAVIGCISFKSPRRATGAFAPSDTKEAEFLQDWDTLSKDTQETQFPSVKPPQSRSGIRGLREDFFFAIDMTTANFNPNAECAVRPK